MNEAAILAACKGGPVIESDDLEEALERTLMGPKRPARAMSGEEKLITAYHESGHALVVHLVPGLDPVHRVSIVSRGLMGGYTRLLPKEERHYVRRSHFVKTLSWMLGGQVAEELLLGEVTTGSSNDIQLSSELARDMICRYGMSGEVGPIALGRQQRLLYLGGTIGENRNFSESTARVVDEEVERLMRAAWDKARGLLSAHRENLDTVARTLVQREILTGRELVDLVAGGGRMVLNGEKLSGLGGPASPAVSGYMPKP